MKIKKKKYNNFHGNLNNNLNNNLNYNILIILNDGYLELGKIFLNSFYENCNLDKVNKIYVGDIGLNDENRNFLKKTYDKIEIINTGNYTSFTKIHSEDWIKSVSQKTRILLDLVKKVNETIILMDADMVNFHDFSHVIDTDYDIQVCRREKPSKRDPVIDENKYIMKYIASFLIINNKNSIQFIESWIEKLYMLINKKITPAFETPALCLVIEEFKNIIKIADIDEKIVACNNNYYSNLTSVVHMKTNGQIKINENENYTKEELIQMKLKARINAVKNVDPDLIYNFKYYINKVITIYDYYNKNNKIFFNGKGKNFNLINFGDNIKFNEIDISDIENIKKKFKNYKIVIFDFNEDYYGYYRCEKNIEKFKSVENFKKHIINIRNIIKTHFDVIIYNDPLLVFDTGNKYKTYEKLKSLNLNYLKIPNYLKINNNFDNIDKIDFFPVILKYVDSSHNDDEKISKNKTELKESIVNFKDKNRDKIVIEYVDSYIPEIQSYCCLRLFIVKNSLIDYVLRPSTKWNIHTGSQEIDLINKADDYFKKFYVNNLNQFQLLFINLYEIYGNSFLCLDLILSDNELYLCEVSLKWEDYTLSEFIKKNNVNLIKNHFCFSKLRNIYYNIMINEIMNQKDKIQIVMCSDENTIEPMCVMIKSILLNTVYKNLLRFNLITNSEERFKKCFERLCPTLNMYYKNIRFTDIDDNMLNNNIKCRGWGKNYLNNKYNFARFFFPELLPDLDKIIYFDVDMLFCGDIYNLYNLLPDNEVMGVVNSKTSKFSKWVYKDTLKENNIDPNSFIFNAGMFITKLNWWRQNNITRKLIDLSLKNNYIRTYNGGNQAPLNIIFHNKKFELDFCWNSSGFGEKEQDDKFKKNAKNIHWTGRHKPWLQDENTDLYHSKIWYYYKNLNLTKKKVNIYIDSSIQVNRVDDLMKISKEIKLFEKFNIQIVDKMEKCDLILLLLTSTENLCNTDKKYLFETEKPIILLERCDAVNTWCREIYKIKNCIGIFKNRSLRNLSDENDGKNIYGKKTFFKIEELFNTDNFQINNKDVGINIIKKNKLELMDKNNLKLIDTVLWDFHSSIFSKTGDGKFMTLDHRINEIDFDKKYDIFCVNQNKKNDYVDKPREKAKDIVKKLSKKYKVNTEKLSSKDYHRIFKKSKICVACWGYGEWVHMDGYALYSGVILIKPECDYVKMYPDIYKSNKHYIPCKPDFSDLEEVIENILNNYDSYKEMLINNRKFLLEHTEEKTAEIFWKKVIDNYNKNK
jgi:lipopolysaccharide biosynthesis glycosyltransferase